MSLLITVVFSVLASLGVALTLLEILRRYRAKKESFVCICFREELLESAKPDMLIVCKSDAEVEEIIKRVSDGDARKVYIKRW